MAALDLFSRHRLLVAPLERYSRHQDCDSLTSLREGFISLYSKAQGHNIGHIQRSKDTNP